MKTLIAFLVATLTLAASPLRAASMNPEHTITVSQAAELLLGLNLVSKGHPCAAGGGVPNPISPSPAPDPKAPPVQKEDNCQYHLDGPVIMAIGRDIKALTDIIQAAKEAQERVTRDVLGDSKSASPEQNKILEEKTKAILDSPQAFIPSYFTAQDLRLGEGADKNAIPPAVVALILPVVTEPESAKK